jgi:diacylglycerol kinase (ATP)
MRPHSAVHSRLTAAPARPARRPQTAFPAAGRDVELVVNANASGAGEAADVVARATHHLRTAGARVRARLTADEHELAAVVAEATDRRLVLVGGDGTVHAFANLDRATLPAAALLPAGRANNIARALGIPVDWQAAAQLAVRGRPRAFDALRVDTPGRTMFAVEGVSAGFHAAARHRYQGTNSADIAAGVRAFGAELRAFRAHRVALNVDDEPLFAGRAAQVFVSNLPYFGFGFRVDPMADPSDGRLEAIVLEGSNRREVVRLLAAARGGRHLGRAGVTWSHATEARSEEPLPVVADAQPLGVTTVAVSVAAGHLRLVAPEVRS